MPDTEVKSPSSLARYLRPDRFDVEPSSVGSDLRWNHWKCSFGTFLAEEGSKATEEIKLKVLINHISPTTYNIIRDCTKHTEVVTLLNNTFKKRKNVLLARHQLTSRKQQPGESVAEYCRALTSLAHDCHFKEVSGDEHQNQAVRGAFITGLSALKIRERLLEKSEITLDEALAISLETAENTSHILQTNTTPLNLNVVELKLTHSNKTW